jgi:hypothetical protein
LKGALDLVLNPKPKTPNHKQIKEDLKEALDLVDARVIKLTNRRSYCCIEIVEKSSASLPEGIDDAADVIKSRLLQAKGVVGGHVVSVSVESGSLPPLLPGEVVDVRIFNSSTFTGCDPTSQTLVPVTLFVIPSPS